jgi:hypothetical protein
MRGMSNGVKETGKQTKVILKQNKYKSCVLLLTEAPSFNKHTHTVESAVRKSNGSNNARKSAFIYKIYNFSGQ